VALGCKIGLEDLREHLWRDPRSRVPDLHQDVVPRSEGSRRLLSRLIFGHCHVHPSALGHRILGVKEQVGEHPSDLALVDVRYPFAGRDVQVTLHVAVEERVVGGDLQKIRNGHGLAYGRAPLRQR